MTTSRIAPILVIALLAANCYGALPPESELPRQMAQAAEELPAESELPPSSAPEAPPVEDQATENLPGENLLPPEVDGGAPPEPAGPLPLAGSPDGIPWLRLNLRGHTAPIRAVEFLPDGDRLCTAGDDKSVVVWLRDSNRAGRWQYERTIRWQIQRGTRGRIYALASSPGLLAIGGEGAMGGTGEIVLVDPASGDFVTTLFDEQNGHRQVVVSLNFVETHNGPALASQSMDGRTLLWTKNEQGLWRARVALPDDRSANVELALAQRLLQGRTFSAVEALDENRVIAPVYDRTEQNQIAWRLDIIDTTNGAKTPLGGPRAPSHWNSVTDLASDATRTRLVSADAAGRVYLWDLKANPIAVRPLNRTQQSQVLSLALSTDGNTLSIGTVAGVEIWDLADPRAPRMSARRNASQPTLACSLHSGAKELAFSNGNAVVVGSLSVNTAAHSLRGAADIPLRVAFPNEEPFYRIGIGTMRADGGRVPINRIYDTDQLRLTRTDQEDQSLWLSNNGGRWSVVESTDNQRRRVWSLQEAGATRARLQLSEERTGAYRSVCWIPSDNPTMAAIGTSAGGILVVQLKPDGEAPILRRFRGHSSDVTSLAISQDLRWLASTSNDATVCVWPLRDVAKESTTINRWGATFQIDDAGRLTIDSIREDGPLYFRGARQGDEVVSCEWSESGQNRKLEAPQELLSTLADVPWDRVIKFELRTGRQRTRSFQILPAWQQLVSLVMDADGEWAYWAPSGYYDASFEGHRLFGWQINRGLEELPDFFLAAQFRAVLEKPQVMSRLLRAGSVEAAFQGAQLESPADSAQTIANTYRLKPEVTILAAHEDGESQQRRTLQARIRVPAGQSLVRAKAFANGVVAPPGELITSETRGGDEFLTYQWNLAVPSDPRVLVQVLAATDAEIVATDQAVWQNTVDRARRKPRLFLLAAGIDEYQDAQIPKLRTPVAHVKEITDLLRSAAGGIYEVEATSLLNDRATRPAWEFLTQCNAERLREEASPDDLLVIYISGHGVQDPVGDQYHFITANAEYREVMSGSYADCLSFEDFSQFVDISCRKLVILDTCHGGAIQPLRHREMKMAVRALQQDLLVTLAASDGAEEAVEGRFSTRLIEGLSGAADRDDGNGDGIVKLDELIAYIKRNVGEDSARDAVIQTPSAGPIDLLPFVSPPLSQVAASRDSLGRAQIREH